MRGVGVSGGTGDGEQGGGGFWEVQVMVSEGVGVSGGTGGVEVGGWENLGQVC